MKISSGGDSFTSGVQLFLLFLKTNLETIIFAPVNGIMFYKTTFFKKLILRTYNSTPRAQQDKKDHLMHGWIIKN
jgi:hypothetical protein